nr:unnamed protein product [Digitaria exilis]
MMEGGSPSPSCLVFRGWQLPPGFRFQPTDQEIIVCYLKKKIAGAATAVTSIVADVDIYKFDPWDLPEKALFGDGEWFFFSPRDRKYPNGARPNRTAGSGYWKATGTDKPILATGGAQCLGVKKALVFYQGRSPKGTKTHWVMHEYRLLDTDVTKPSSSCSSSSSMRLDDWVLCRVRNKHYLQAAGVDDGGSSYYCHSSAPSSELAPPPIPLPPSSSSCCTATTTNDHLLHYLTMVQHPEAHDEDQDHEPAAAAQLVSSVLESIKRNLSFQAIDELYLLHQPTTKRANCTTPDDDHHRRILNTTTTSFSISPEAADCTF